MPHLLDLPNYTMVDTEIGLMSALDLTRSDQRVRGVNIRIRRQRVRIDLGYEQKSNKV